MTVTSVKLGGAGDLKYVMDLPNQKLRIDLGQPYQPADELTAVIEYHTNGSQTRLAGLVGAALRFIKPTPEDPTRPKQIWSQGESEYNHYWFPCYDHPNDFFTSEITATVEKPLSVISNGKLLETKDNKDGTRAFHWKIDQPHASYLTSIIVGEYTPIASDYLGIPITTYVYPSEIEEGKITTARLTEMVKFFSEKTGLKYPYAKYAQTTARDFGGGMENISATTQTDNMIHDARTELDANTDGLQSHELAHQWFGDYVTCRDWSDIWLNESFATYFQAMWDEHKLGGDDFSTRTLRQIRMPTWRPGDRATGARLLPRTTRVRIPSLTPTLILAAGRCCTCCDKRSEKIIGGGQLTIIFANTPTSPLIRNSFELRLKNQPDKPWTGSSTNGSTRWVIPFFE